MTKFIILAMYFVVSFTAQAKLPDDCDCPEAKCSNPCDQQDGVTFYSEKCNGGARVKSCAKPTCVPKTEMDEMCLSFKKSQDSGRAIASKEDGKAATGESKPVSNLPEVGSISLLSGHAWIQSELGDRKVASKDMVVHESDSIITNAEGKVQITMKDGNSINILPNSQTKLTKMQAEGDEKSTLIDLIKGKVRSKVVKKYKGAEYFKVRTQSAVAGVRGTEFVVSYEVGEKAITKVQTLEGAVDLKSKDEKQTQSLLAGQEGSFVVAANTNEVFSEDEINSFVSRGYMTPVYKLTESELKKLNIDTNMDGDQVVEQAVAKLKPMKGEQICAAPKGNLNQCAWECMNNPSGEKKCRTDLSKVNCVRRRCNANGEWADELRLPASYQDYCAPQGVQVKECDY